MTDQAHFVPRARDVVRGTLDLPVLARRAGVAARRVATKPSV